MRNHDGQKEGEVLAALRAMDRLQEVSVLAIQSKTIESLLDVAVKAAIDLQAADFGNIQLYDPETGILTLAAQQGFDAPFLEHFAVVSVESTSACGLALERLERVAIEDVETDAAYEASRDIARRTGYRSVQSTPLVTRNREVVGMLSTHWRAPHKLSELDCGVLDILARQTADLIERQQREDALHAEVAQRKRVEAALKQANAVKDDFLSIVSHELRTPLTLIRGNAHVLSSPRGLSEPDRKAALEDLVAEAERLTQIVENMLALGRIEVGGMIPTEPVMLAKVVRDVARKFERQWLACNLTVDGEDILVLGVDQYIRQILENLIDNAHKYSAGDPEIEIRWRPHGTHLLVSILDRGRGVRVPDQLFTPFSREQTIEEGIQGMGIGLAVCKRLVEAQGGTIGVTPREGGGSAFWFTLPLVPPDPATE